MACEKGAAYLPEFIFVVCSGFIQILGSRYGLSVGLFIISVSSYTVIDKKVTLYGL
jgi:hypothetical protein